MTSPRWSLNCHLFVRVSCPYTPVYTLALDSGLVQVARQKLDWCYECWIDLPECIFAGFDFSSPGCIAVLVVWALALHVVAGSALLVVVGELD